jgi:hypothetical protein
MGAPANSFTLMHLPMLWSSLLAEFGCTLDYLPGHDLAAAVPIQVIWKEGAEDEETSPGRYSNIWVQNSDLATGPRKGDGVVRDGKTYDVVLVGATAYGYSRAVLQESD